MLDAGAEHLLAQVGASVNQDVSAGGGNEGSRAEAVVERVVRRADFAIAADDRDSLRGAGAEEREFQVVAQGDANDAANISKTALLRLGLFEIWAFLSLIPLSRQIVGWQTRRKNVSRKISFEKTNPR